jgi:hypothetical protein
VDPRWTVGTCAPPEAIPVKTRGVYVRVFTSPGIMAIPRELTGV